VDQIRFIQSDLRIQHRHDDGSWGDMIEERPHEDAAEHDIERAWATGRIFRCSSCADAITVVPTGAEDPGQPG
jgi:hypothetical protein